MLVLVWQRQLATQVVIFSFFCRVQNCCQEAATLSITVFPKPLSLHLALTLYLLGPYDCSLWKVSNPFQTEIRYHYTIVLKLALFFGQLNVAGKSKETLEN